MKLQKYKSNNPRYVALQILSREKDNYLSHIKLSKALEKSILSSRDRALVTQLVNGINRNRLFLDWAINLSSTRPVDKIDNKVKGLLRLGAYQLLRLTRIPPYAAISETVELSKNFFKSPVVKYINAVLRSIDRQRDILQNGPLSDDITKFISIYYSHPEWMVDRWLKRWGEDFTRKLCEFNNNPPRLTLRVNTLKISPKELKVRLEADGIEVSSSNILPYEIEILSNLRAEELDEYKEGLFTIQGEAPMLAGKILNPMPGEKIFDLCAAPGNKTTHLAELMNNRGKIFAVDISKERLSVLSSACERLGIKIVTPLTGDVLKLENNMFFDKVLLDAPCSGTGVLARRSDLRWNKEIEDIQRLSLLQRDLLEKGASFVKSGGYIVYSVCSLEPEEGEEVVKNFISKNSEFTFSDISDGLPKELVSGKSSFGLFLLPPVHGTEGFFISRIKRK